MTDLIHAKTLLLQNNHTCVLCKGDAVHISDQNGIAPMVGFLTGGTDLKGFSAADVVVGKAAALLFALAGVTAVYAEVLSERAIPVLDRFGIAYQYGELTPMIVNRDNTGSCPMEQTVEQIEDPEKALPALQATMARLRAAAMANAPAK